MTDLCRGQSETVGVVLLTAVIVISVSVLGAGILSSGAQSVDKPLVDLDIDITTTTISVTHDGGDTVDGTSLDIIIRNETASQRYESAVTGQFKPTDTVTQSHTYTGTVTVLVVYTDSNTVLGRESRTLYTDTGTDAETTPATETDTGETPTAEPPAIDSATLPGTPIDDTEANSNVERPLTLTFDDEMDQTVAPTIELDGVTDSSATVVTADGGWTTSTTYEVPIRFADNDVDETVDVEVSGATDTDGTEMSPQTALSFLLDSRSPGDVNGVVVEPDAITRANQDAVDVTVTDPDSLDGDETAIVTLEDQTGTTITRTAAIDPSTSETTLTFDTTALADGAVTPTAVVEDDVGNRGDSVTNDQTPKDTTEPTVDSFTATEDGSRTFTVTLEATERTAIQASDVTLDVSGPGTVENTEQLNLDNSGSSFTYEIKYTVSQPGEYTVTLSKLEDAYGNDGATGQTESVALGDAADSVSYRDDASTFGSDGSGVTLSVENTASTSVSVRNVTVSTNAASVLYEGQSGSTRTEHEIRVVGSSTGFWDTDKERNAGKDGYTIGETATLSGAATIAGDSTAEVTMYEFIDSGSGNSGKPVDMADKNITVTLGFADGSELTFTVRP
ncbi:type IV pilin [Haloarcula sp. CBA1130]|uniref:type IV pilin N-terminal domain-containing protein n=1 Tax=unclassified Haloarcula TaxID=2624677 RepID=UPI00124913F2|nr:MULTISPECIES: type IV pilin N-terminal domain-containing protein [unclassified Haloarcula]KAA9399852.1 type IV pilin [Haloarcula sp. CBA1129]KAA9401547.1 type IV pilin [Haloarcula sp. CBA1130]